MKNKFLMAALASLALAASSAYAEEGFYLGIAGGGNKVHEDKVEGAGVSADAEYDWGYAATGTLGYKYDNGLRSELELGYRKNDLDTVGAFDAKGNVDTMTAMLNVLYDFDISDTGIDTYLGVGGGVAKVDYNRFRAAGGTVINDSDTVPAVQGIVGASYAVSDATDAFVNYQYLHAIDTKYRAPSGASIETDYDSSTILVGLKFNMYDTPEVQPEPTPAPARVAAPAPAPEPAPEPVSRTYLVFFDFDKTDLTQEAQAVLSQAAEDARAGRAVALKVVGHADRAGTESYNMALSNRRANVVKSALSQLGITSGSIQTLAKGETDPLVQTEDGVREPQNRRVEIMYVIEPRK